MLLLSCFNRVWFFATAWTIVHQAPCPWDSPGKNTGVGWHALLQGIFLTQGSNLHLLYCRQFPYHWATGEAQARLIYQNKQWLKCSKSLFLTLIKYSGHKWLSWRQWFKDLVLSSLRVLHVPRPYHCLGGRESRVSFLKVLAQKYLTSNWLEFIHTAVSSCKEIWEIQSCMYLGWKARRLWWAASNPWASSVC